MEERFNCPYCISNGKTVDTKKHLYVNKTKGVYFCFRCGAKGRIKDFIPIVDYDLDNLKKRLNNAYSLDEPINLDEISRTISKESKAYEYLRMRHFTDEEIEKFNIRVGNNNYWKDRILFPFMRNKQCYYVVGRSYYDNVLPKYLNQAGKKNGYIYNIENLSGDSCIVCEGIISAISAMRWTNLPSISVLGKYISKTQAFVISGKVKNVYLCFDGDVSLREAMPSIETLYKAHVNKVYFVELPMNHDPDSIGEKIKYYIENSRLVEWGRGINGYV